jgi:hypothetical protein
MQAGKGQQGTSMASARNTRSRCIPTHHQTKLIFPFRTQADNRPALQPPHEDIAIYVVTPRSAGSELLVGDPPLSFAVQNRRGYYGLQSKMRARLRNRQGDFIHDCPESYEWIDS